MTSAERAKVEAGQVYRNWTVLSFDKQVPDKPKYWNCKCICGREKSVSELTLLYSKRTNKCFSCPKGRLSLDRPRKKNIVLALAGLQTEATCRKCGYEGPVADFRTPHKKGYEGYPYYDYCKTCHVFQSRAGRYMLLYKITEEEYQKILTFQNGGCAICNKKPKNARLAVDHDHLTGLVRGLLCWRCNNAVGKFRDKQFLLWAAFCYLFSPPAVLALGEKRFGVVGRISKKSKNRIYGGPHLEIDQYKMDPEQVKKYLQGLI